MKKIALSLAALSLLAPSVAMAGSAASLSVRSAVVQPARAAAPKGKIKAVATPLIILGVLVVVGGGILLLDDDDSDSN